MRAPTRTSTSEDISAWQTRLACAWVMIAEGGGVSAIDYASMAEAATRSPGPTTPASADAAMVEEVDIRLTVSRLVDRARVYAGDKAFQAWLLRRVEEQTWTQVSKAVGTAVSTAPRLVARFDACVLNLHRGESIENYLTEGERWAWVPEMDQDYIVTSRGALFSLKTGALEELRATSEGRARLYRQGREYKPRVAVLLERCFGAAARAAYEAAATEGDGLARCEGDQG